MIMRKKVFLYIMLFAVNNCIYSASAETKTATFDFSVNTYGFPECTSISEIMSKRIEVDTKIETNGITMTLAPSPYGGDNFPPCWYLPYSSLYFNYKSCFELSADQPTNIIKQVVITFAGDMTGTKGYFIDSFKTFQPLNFYTLNNNIGTLDLSEQKYSSVGWYCTQEEKLQIKQIDVLYEVDPATSVTETVASDYQLEIRNGFINILGNYNTIEIYNISGILISKNKINTYCPPGIYIVRIDGKAKKVIVK